MQIVIDIPHEVKKDFDDCKGKFISHGYDLIDAIKNGTVLSEPHGRLIDADKLEYICDSDVCGMPYDCNVCAFHTITECEIDKVPTIIEASEVSE